MKRTIMVCLNLLIGNAFAYEAVDRYILLEDKFKTEEMLRPLKHDFLFDITAHANRNLLKFTKDIGEIGDLGGTLTNRIDQAGTILQSYDRTEQTLHAKINLGFPIFGFKVGTFAFDPSIRVGLEFGSNLGVRSLPLTSDLILQLVGNQIPQAFRTTIATTTFLPGEDIMERVCVVRGIPMSACPNTGQYFYPTLASVPLISVFTKLDAKVGLNLPYKGRYWFGDFNLYGMFRTDFKLLMSADQIARGQSPLEGDDDLKQQIFAIVDYKLGYRKSNYDFFVSIEEFEITRISENINEAGELNQRIDPLYRFHMNATYRPGLFLLRPFIGVHKRDNYKYKNGAYIGMDVGTLVFNDHLGLLFRGMGDQEHLSLSVQGKLALFHFEYILKTPLKDEIDNVRISTIHSINLRFSI